MSEKLPRHNKLLRAAGLFGATVLAGGVIAVGIGLNDLRDKGMLADYGHLAFGELTTQEAKLTQASQETFGTRLAVRCADMTEANKALEEQNKEGVYYEGYIIPVLGMDAFIVKHPPEICDSAISTIGKRSFNNEYQLAAAAISLEAITHENQHALHPDASESVIECYAMQETNKLAMNLQTSISLANEIAEEAIKLRADTAPDNYKVPANCYDNGPYDLDPEHSGIFPIN